MKKNVLLSALIAAGLAVAPFAPAAFAQDKKDGMMKKDDAMSKDKDKMSD